MISSAICTRRWASSLPFVSKNYYNNIFGNVMASFVVDHGDSVLGGNVIISQNLNLGGGLNVSPL